MGRIRAADNDLGHNLLNMGCMVGGAAKPDPALPIFATVYTLSVPAHEDAMPKAAIFTMKLEAELRAEFMAAAEADHRPASQVVRELMRDYVQRQQERRDHGALVRRKVDAARASVQAGRGLPDDAVEADFAARRARITDRA